MRLRFRRTCEPAYSVLKFARVWHRCHVFPRLATVAYFLTFGVSYNFSSTWHLLNILPRLASVTRFPLFSIGYILRALQLFNVFPSLAW